MDSDFARILEWVESYYKQSGKPLLLSTLGEELKKVDLWPISGNQKSLSRIVQELSPSVTIDRDPHFPAFAVVVLTGYEHIASEAIEHRRRSTFLERLPKALILSFCVKKATGRNVYVRLNPPKYYIGDDAPSSDFKLVEDRFRLEGLPSVPPHSLGHEDSRRLYNNINEWSRENSISWEQITGKEIGRETTIDKVGLPHSSGTEKPGRTALSRLLDAQSGDLASRVVIPLDIALALSRLP